MQVNLYLHKDTFCYNGTDSREDLVNKLNLLTNDLAKIKSTKGSNIVNILVSSDLSITDIYQKENIFNLLKEVSPEAKILFYSIIGNTSEYCDSTIEEIKKKCIYKKDEEECNSLVYLNVPEETNEAENYSKKPYIQFDNYEIIYNFQTWQTLERQILGNHPGDSNHFLTECKRLFNNMYFHQNCEITLSEVVDKIPRAIVCHLACMNDNMQKFLKNSGTKQANDLLMEFAGEFHLCEGSLNRSGRYKSILTFEFPTTKDPNQKAKKYCDPHFKLDKCDSNCESFGTKEELIYGRIYFNFGDPEVANGKLLVGWIGKHA